MEHVAALAKRGEIPRAVAARVMLEVAAREHHPRDRQPSDRIEAGKDWLLSLNEMWRRQPAHPPAAAVPPAPVLLVPPCAVAQMDDLPPVRPAAALAPAFRPLEADQPRQFGPIDRVQPAVLGSDRHGETLSHIRLKAKSCMAVKARSRLPAGAVWRAEDKP